MKRAIKFLSVVFLFTVSVIGKAVAQDDVYYDPNKDKGLPAQPAAEQYDDNSQNQQATESNTTQSATDKTDGYGNPADKYDPRDNYSSNSYDNSSYATDAGYYDEDYDSYFYTTRLRRYYAPNYGTSYYSYWYTPSYYVGLNNWNSPYVVSYSPWYSDPWWRWNRTTVVIGYDPFYSPYWSWNFGWNSCAYYNSWSNPYGGCFGNGNGYGSYGGWGYGGGCGFGGGYGYGGGYGGGYNNGYYNGYNNGYYNGYNDGYWNSSAYNNNGGFHYYGPRHRNSVSQPTTGNTGGGVSGGGLSNPGVVKGTPVTNGVVIPREGITKPVNLGNTPNGVKVEAGRPYENGSTIKNDPRGAVVNQPTINTTEGRTNIPANNDGRNASNLKPLTGIEPARTNTTAPVNTNTGRIEQARPADTKPFVRQSPEPEGWHEVPADRNYGNRKPVQQPASPGNGGLQQRGNYTNQQPNNTGFQQRPNNVPVQQPSQKAGNNNGGWNRTEPRTVEPQRPINNAREIPQQRNIQQQQPRQQQPAQQQPTYREAPRNNYNPAPQQRMESAPRMNVSPSPQGGGGGFKRR